MRVYSGQPKGRCLNGIDDLAHSPSVCAPRHTASLVCNNDGSPLVKNRPSRKLHALTLSLTTRRSPGSVFEELPNGDGPLPSHLASALEEQFENSGDINVADAESPGLASSPADLQPSPEQPSEKLPPGPPPSKQLPTGPPERECVV